MVTSTVVPFLSFTSLLSFPLSPSHPPSFYPLPSFPFFSSLLTFPPSRPPVFISLFSFCPYIFFSSFFPWPTPYLSSLLPS